MLSGLGVGGSRVWGGQWFCKAGFFREEEIDEREQTNKQTNKHILTENCAL